MKNILAIILIFTACAIAQSLSGGSGLLRTPTARLNKDATVILGSSFLAAETLPYTQYKRDVQAIWAAVSFLPFLEVSLRLSHQLGLPKNSNHTADRMASCKMKLLSERHFLPAVLVGVNDLSSTVEGNRARHFAASYAVVSKNMPVNGLVFSPSAGYAFKLFPANHYDFSGWFGGLKLYFETFDPIAFLLEFESGRVNTGVRFNLFNHFYMNAAWMKLEQFSCSAGYAFNLNKVTQLY